MQVRGLLFSILGAAVISLAYAAPVSAGCKIVNGQIKCDEPGSGDGGGTLIVINDPEFKTPGALGETIKQILKPETLDAQGLEMYRESLEEVNKQIETDRLTVEKMRETGQFSMEKYKSKITDYHMAIGNYKNGIALYRQQMR
jgi:hypothetical protein